MLVLQLIYLKQWECNHDCRVNNRKSWWPQKLALNFTSIFLKDTWCTVNMLLSELNISKVINKEEQYIENIKLESSSFWLAAERFHPFHLLLNSGAWSLHSHNSNPAETFRIVKLWSNPNRHTLPGSWNLTGFLLAAISMWAPCTFGPWPRNKCWQLGSSSVRKPLTLPEMRIE